MERWVVKGSFRIADCFVEPELNSLTRNGKTRHLEPKVMKVLVLFAQHPNEVLSKEFLVQAVWRDTFVSDDVLTRCISILRGVMGDSSRNSTIIQTIPKTGYRLLAKTAFEPETTAAVQEAATNASSAIQKPELSPLPVPVRAVEAAADISVVPSHRHKITWRIVLALAAVAVALILWKTYDAVNTWNGQSAFRVVPFTSYAGLQTQPAFSPDGGRVAFVWDGGNGGRRAIYVKQFGSESLLRLTPEGSDSYSPAWSPDGTQLAYFSTQDGGLGIYLVSSLGGPARKIYAPNEDIEWQKESLSWSPDGKFLAFPDLNSAQEPVGISILALDTIRISRLTHPASGVAGDWSPAFSSDGRHLAFVRALEGAVRDIYVVPVKGGTPTQITFDNCDVESLTWSSDNRSILFSSDRGGKFALWRVAAKGGTPRRLSVGTDDAYEPAIASKTNRLAYVQRSATWNTLRYDLTAKSGHESPAIILTSAQQETAPAYSPDGKRFAFQSWRSGTQEIWLASDNGTTLQQLSYIDRSITGSPQWSPDKSLIAFDSRPQGHSHVYVMSSAGGPPNQLTSGNYNDILPHFSVDGRSIYFSSNRSGRWQIWKIAVSGGPPRQVTQNGGFFAEESADGKTLYYARASESGIWRLSLATGVEQRILDQPLAGYWGYWCLTVHGIYYMDTAMNPPEIRHLDPATGRSVQVIGLSHLPPVYAGLAISPNERTLLISDMRDATSHISLVENFR
jgi:Tol biopolymer transport system component/DNA-binding winged helix-turn-helix (wHTH) protein